MFLNTWPDIRPLSTFSIALWSINEAICGRAEISGKKDAYDRAWYPTKPLHYVQEIMICVSVSLSVSFFIFCISLFFILIIFIFLIFHHNWKSKIFHFLSIHVNCDGYKVTQNTFIKLKFARRRVLINLRTFTRLHI